MPDNKSFITPESKVTLREVTADTVRTILKLDVTDVQKQFVAPNAVSISQAYFSEHAWFRAIYADETPVGFILLVDDPVNSSYHLWRLMIDAHFQNRGFGRRALELAIEYVKTRPGAKVLSTSFAPGEESPGKFYEKMGFIYTGEMDEDGELIMQYQF